MRLYIEISFSQDGRGRGLQESEGGGSERLNERGACGGGEKRHAVPGLYEDTHSNPWPGTLHLGTIVIRTSKNFIPPTHPFRKRL